MTAMLHIAQLISLRKSNSTRRSYYGRNYRLQTCIKWQISSTLKIRLNNCYPIGDVGAMMLTASKQLALHVTFLTTSHRSSRKSDVRAYSVPQPYMVSVKNLTYHETRTGTEWRLSVAKQLIRLPSGTANSSTA